MYLVCYSIADVFALLSQGRSVKLGLDLIILSLIKNSNLIKTQLINGFFLSLFFYNLEIRKL
jgi:hypothetical protein